MEALFKSTPDLHSIDQDLLLAAEIGKTLLEKNRELEIILKSTQDFAEEKAAQADFYVKQVEILRESNESCAHACEVLEGTNQALHDKYDQLNADHKILQGKNNRLWELINSLEKKNEDLGTEVKELRDEIEEKEKKVEQLSIGGNNQVEKNGGVLTNGGAKGIFDDDVVDESFSELQKSNLEAEVENLKNESTELKVQVKIEKWQKDEMDSQMQDVIQENQLLHHKIAELNKEILDWESFAQKEECYRRIAEAFTIKHNIEIEETFVQTVHHNALTCSPSNLAKAKSCEFLNCVPATEACPNIIKGSSNVRNIILAASLQSKNSILSELDKEYDDLVKRYEALLEKCQQDGKFNENPERTRKVQRAIQTLSLDFSKLTTSILSPVKPVKTPTGDEKGSTTTVSTGTQQQQHGDDDYRQLFSQIFAKLKEVPANEKESK